MDEFERIERRISLHDVRVLVAVIAAGSMGKAAARLATSQPAISRSIAELENALGVRLLDRTQRGIEPTEYGHAIAKRGIAVFDELAQGVKDIKFLADPTAGELRIGASVAVAAGFASGVIDRLLRRFPRLSFRVLATDTQTAYRALIERELDLLVIHLNEPLGEEVSADVLFHDPQVVVAGANSPWVRRRRLALADVVHEPWMLPAPETPYGAIVREAFHAAGLDVPATAVMSTLPVRAALLATGRFLSMVPRIVLHFPTPPQTFKKLPIDLPTTPRPLAIVTLRNRTLSPVAELFAECARELGKLATIRN